HSPPLLRDASPDGLKQDKRFDCQSRSQSVNVHQREISLATLNLSDVTSVKVGTQGQLFLGDALQPPDLAQPAAKLAFNFMCTVLFQWCYPKEELPYRVTDCGRRVHGLYVPFNFV